MAASFATMRTFPVLLVMALFVQACGDGKHEAADRMAEADSLAALVATAPIDLTPYDAPLLLTPPPQELLGADTVEVRWNEEFGRIEVRAGDHFGLNIAEEPMDVARLKADLERDMLQRHTVLREEPGLLVYRSQFPDEQLVLIHFMQAHTVGGRTFTVTDAEGGRYNEADIDRMIASLQVKQPV